MGQTQVPGNELQTIIRLISRHWALVKWSLGAIGTVIVILGGVIVGLIVHDFNSLADRVDKLDNRFANAVVEGVSVKDVLQRSKDLAGDIRNTSKTVNEHSVTLQKIQDKLDQHTDTLHAIQGQLGPLQAVPDQLRALQRQVGRIPGMPR